MIPSPVVQSVILGFALTAFCPGSITAQDQVDVTSAAPSPAIVLATTSPEVAAACYAQFDWKEALGEIPLDHHLVMTVGSDGSTKIETKAGDIGYLSMSVYPKAVLALYESWIDERWETIRDSAALGLTQLGMSAKQAAIMMRDARTFPEQVQAVELTVSQDPQTLLKGMRVHLKVRPTPGSWIGKVFAMMRPHPQGAPHLSNQAGMVRISAAIDTNGLSEMLSPVINILSGVGARNKAQRTSNASMFQGMLQAFDGGLFSSGDPFGGRATNIFGLRDAKAMSSILESEGFTRYSELTGQLNGIIETEVEQAVFTHRGIPVMQTTLISDYDSAATVTLGDQISYAAVAGSLLLSAGNSKADDIKPLIDGALDQKISRKPLADNALVLVDVKFMEFLDKISPVGNPLEGTGDNPQSLHISLGSAGGDLNLRISID